MRKMGLDIGDKRIGVAVSDALNITAQGKTVIVRKEHQKDLRQIEELIQKYNITEVVAGLPVNMDNTEGPQVDKVRNYVNFLKNNLEIPVVFWDERLTSLEAERVLIKADLSRAQRKKVIDQVAASLILQNYLDHQNYQKEREDNNG
ncbi:MAG: Holliday junction resolvase RuvX [Halanaerobiaceae bacterium]